MTRSKGELNAIAETVLMGCAHTFTESDELDYVYQYIMKTMTGKECKTTARQVVPSYFKDEPAGLCTNTLYGMKCVTIMLKSKRAKSLNPCKPSGVLCYVQNIDAPDCSEGGYCFFERNAAGIVRRVG